ncbi:YbaK/EbsC family protein [bacterium]|nr:YbaK/EbsC family protein [bacterium]
MSKSLTRVTTALAAAGIGARIVETAASTRTAAEAAAAAGVTIDQIVKSILFQDQGGALCLFLTAGGNQVDGARAAALAGRALSRADAARVRAVTGFAIGGVAPLGHLTPLPVWLDRRLLDFVEVWAAAGTPNHIFAIDPATLCRLTGAVVADFTT